MRDLSVYLLALIIFGLGLWLQLLKWHRRKVTLFSGQICQDAHYREPAVDRTEKRLALGVWIIATILFAVFASTREQGWAAVWPTAIFAILFSPVVCLSVRTWRIRLRSWLSAAPTLRSLLLWLATLSLPVIYLVAAGVQVHAQYPLLALIGIIVILLARIGRVAEYAIDQPLVIIVVALLLWVPIELHLVYGLPLPAYGGIQVARLLIVGLGILFFMIVAPLPDLGYSLRIPWMNIRTAAIAFAAFAGAAIPLGLALGFIEWTPAAHQWYMSIGLGFVIYFVTAIPEELLFRGVFQNLLEWRWPGRNRAAGSLIAGAIIFGLAHLDNPPAPNYRYVLMATIAGLAYGWVWQKTRSITASALTHAAVDWTWLMFFLK